MSFEPLALSVAEIRSPQQLLLRKQATLQLGFQFLKNSVPFGVTGWRSGACLSRQRDYKPQPILQVVKLGLSDQPFFVHVPVLQHQPRQGLKQSRFQLLLGQCREEKFGGVHISAWTWQIVEARISEAS